MEPCVWGRCTSPQPLGGEREIAVLYTEGWDFVYYGVLEWEKWILDIDLRRGCGDSDYLPEMSKVLIIGRTNYFGT